MGEKDFKKVDEKILDGKLESLTMGRLILCYLVAFIFTLVIIFMFTTFIVETLDSIFDEKFTLLEIIGCAAIFYLVVSLTWIIGNHWRADEKEIATPFTVFINPFYEPSYEKGNYVLKNKNKDLTLKLNHAHDLLGESKEHAKSLEESFLYFEDKLRVLLRHNDNANRLIKSFNFLIAKDNDDMHSKMLRNILNECITILEKDKSDKSISLFKIENEQLKIIESVRINAESIAKRSFEKDQGFAGYIWGLGKEEIINVIDDEDQRFSDQGVPKTQIGSILGFPLKVGEDILGVLCIQSEIEDGFNDGDLRIVEYYARLCTLILLHDSMYGNTTTIKGGGSHGVG